MKIPSISPWISTATECLLDLVFPMECVSCHASGEFLCTTCLARIPLRSEQTCPYCQTRITPKGETCLTCQTKTPLNGLLAATYYRHPTVRETIHLYKYRFIENLHIPLAKLLLRHIQNSNISLPDAIIPVPLHPRRLRLRNFNQSELIARFLSQHLAPGFPIPLIDDALIRVRFTTPQMSIHDAKERTENIQGAFGWQPKDSQGLSIQGKSLWLIDDVATTGATLKECAHILKKNGASKVHAIVIAR